MLLLQYTRLRVSILKHVVIAPPQGSVLSPTDLRQMKPCKGVVLFAELPGLVHMKPSHAAPALWWSLVWPSPTIPQEDAGSGHEENVGGSGQHVGREEGPHRHELRQDVSRSPLLLQQELAGQGTKATSLTVQVLLALVGEASAWPRMTSSPWGSWIAKGRGSCRTLVAAETPDVSDPASSNQIWVLELIFPQIFMCVIGVCD